MEKLSPDDILFEVHAAAETLQLKIDQYYYLLVNSENWQVQRIPKEYEDPENFNDVKESEDKTLVISSLSEMWDTQNSNIGIDPSMPEWKSSDSVVKNRMSWPRLSFIAANPIIAEESKVYESASSLSLATFTSLLIEFVARLQNIVDEFEVLSQKANFADPMDPLDAEEVVGFWTRLMRRLRFKNSKPDSAASLS